MALWAEERGHLVKGYRRHCMWLGTDEGARDFAVVRRGSFEMDSGNEGRRGSWDFLYCNCQVRETQKLHKKLRRFQKFYVCYTVCPDLVIKLEIRAFGPFLAPRFFKRITNKRITRAFWVLSNFYVEQFNKIHILKNILKNLKCKPPLKRPKMQ